MLPLSPPAGFVEQRRGKALWWLKVDWESLLPDLVSPHLSQQSAPRLPPPLGGNPPSAVPVKSGRGTIHRIELGTRGALIVRPYLRGGFARHFTRDLYWDYPPRPFVELQCTEEVRRRGVPTVEVVGAQVEQTVVGLYRGLLITREAAGFQDLWRWLQTEKSVDLRQQTLAVVAQVIACMHSVGVVHADLNPTNILVRSGGETPQALLLDFDRARLFAGPVLLRPREANLRRFQRFFAKYDVLEDRMTPTEFGHFYQTYEMILPLENRGKSITKRKGNP